MGSKRALKNFPPWQASLITAPGAISTMPSGTAPPAAASLPAAIEKHHEERYRALLHNVEAKEVFAKSEVKVWECRNCGHIVVGTQAPEVCPVCNHPQAYFEINKQNY